MSYYYGTAQIIWLEKRVAELEEKLEDVSKDRDDWAKKYQELSSASNKTKNEIDFDHAKETQKRYKLVPHGDFTITVTQVKDEK
jgi:hypothetical protein